MTALDLDFVRKAARKSAAAGPARSLDKMTMVHLARRTVIFTVDAAGIASLMDAISSRCLPVMRRVRTRRFSAPKAAN